MEKKKLRLLIIIFVAIIVVAYVGLTVFVLKDGKGIPSKVKIDKRHFPDEAFREYVSENFDKNSDGILDKEEREKVTEVEVACLGITDLKGVDFFQILIY